MKKSFLTLALVLALGAGSAQAAAKKSPSYSGVIKANPLGLALGYFNAQYELPLGTNNTGLNINGSFYSYGSGFFKATGFGAGGMYRFYSKGKGKNLNSFYYGPFLNFASLTWTYDYGSVFGGSYESKASIFAIAPGFGLGRQWIFNGGFTLDVGGGIQYYIAGDLKFEDSNGNEISALAVPSAFQGIFPALWFSLGYAFGK